MNTSVIIMADGIGDRWSEPQNYPIPVEYKQLLPVNKVPLIARTLKQLKSDNITLICPDDLRDQAGIAIPTISLRYGRESLLEGILKTQLYWSDRTIILLGDVCFSNKAIQLLATSELDCFLLGRQGKNEVTGKDAGELFALSFVESKQSELVKRLLEVSNSGGKKLWDLYHRYPMTIYETCDYTDDTDSLEAYTQFWKKIENAAIKDDENEESRKLR